MILNNNSTQQINTLVIQLQNRITNLTNESRKLNNNINDLDSEISDLEKRVSSNENDADNNIDGLDSKISDLERRVSSLANDASAMNDEISANTEAISGKADKIHTHTKSEITDFPTSLKNPNALTINGQIYDGSTAVDAGVQTVANGGTGVTTQADINKAFIGDLEVGDSDVTDSTEFVSSYASNNGFSDTNAINKPYKRKFSAVWNYIKGKISSVLGLTATDYSGKASTAGTADSAKKLKPFAYWEYPYVYDETNGIRYFVFKIQMVPWFNSTLIQIYSDINYSLSRKYILGLWHYDDYGYNVSVTDLGGTISNALRVWLGNDGNVYLQARCEWTSRISFSYLEDASDITVEKIGSSRLGSNKDIDGNVLFTPLTDPIIDCGAIRGASDLSSASKEIQYLKADEFIGSTGTFTEKITAPNITSLEQRVAALESKA